MYIYGLNDDRELVNECTTKSTIVGYVEDYQASKYNHYDKAWVSEEKLVYTNPDGSAAYKVVEDDLISTDKFDTLTFEKDIMHKNVKVLCVELIESYDWKVVRHLEQQILVEAGKLDATSLTPDEYLVLLENKQSYRDLSNIAEQMIDMMVNIDEGRANFNYDFRNPEVVKERITAWKLQYNL